jgi:hypothetical protein
LAMIPAMRPKKIQATIPKNSTSEKDRGAHLSPVLYSVLCRFLFCVCPIATFAYERRSI